MFSCQTASMAVWMELRREGAILALLGVMLGLPITQLPQLQQAGCEWSCAIEHRNTMVD